MLPERLQQKLRDLPDRPGCYLMRDRFGRIIYIGKAASLRHRVRSYFQRAAGRRMDPKLRSLLHSVADLDVLVLPSEADAILTEGKLIKDYRPRYNILLKDDKRFPLLRLDPGHPFPRLRLCRFQRPDGAVYFGPYASSPAARAALEFVEKRCGLRRCAPLVPGPADHRHCLNDIVRFCSAPCIGKITAEAYAERVAEARAFLEGKRPAALQELEGAMLEAARARQFEKAAGLRDSLRLLRLAVRQRAHVRRAPGQPEADALAGIRELAALLGLARPPRVIEAYDLSSISGTLAVGSLVAAEDGIPKPARYRRFRIKTPQAVDDARMMAEVIRRRFSRLLLTGAPPPGLVLVDGGAIQVRAAEAELAGLGLADVPVAGLAKRFETLLFRRQALNLPPESHALRTLQRLRDEAHRFALAYHRRLRARRLRESWLDEVPGIGAARKQALLRRFGSVSRLRRAPESELAALPGIGPALARELAGRARGHQEGAGG